ncbi:hypothetical protein [Bradyrhizobium sp. CB3481]|nr:hypothetical protein [Bradyrhizobium sp. CB3481]WFU14620.1 hypothetical protein QA643_26430 [Bradyrhizobium sp. CB3481]
MKENALRLGLSCRSAESAHESHQKTLENIIRRLDELAQADATTR